MSLMNKVTAVKYDVMYNSLLKINKNNAKAQQYKQEGFKLLEGKVDKLPNDVAFRSKYITKLSSCVKVFDKIYVFISKSNFTKPIQERYDALLHEIGHWLHFQQMPPKAERQAIWNTVDKEAVKKAVSERAIQDDDGKEFVAEVFKGIVKGKKYDSDTIYTYWLLNGPEVKK